MNRQSISCLVVIAIVSYAAIGSAQKVHVELFAEALCPYCAQFTLEKLKPLFSNGISDIMWLDYIPCKSERAGALTYTEGAS
jgi:interferon gamma-inducible protein 30